MRTEPRSWEVHCWDGWSQLGETGGSWRSCFYLGLTGHGDWCQISAKVLSLCTMIRHASELSVYKQSFAGSAPMKEGCTWRPETLSWGICLGWDAGSVYPVMLAQDTLWETSVDFYKQISSPFPQQLYRSIVQVYTTPYAINYSPDWKLLSILKSPTVWKRGILEWSTLQILEKAFVLPFWVVDQWEICRLWTFSFLLFRPYQFRLNPFKINGKVPADFKRNGLSSQILWRTNILNKQTKNG